MDATPADRLTELRVAALARSWHLAGDNRHYFADTYAMMTAAMVAEVNAGTFLDNPWVGRLVGRFTDYYLDAVRDSESGGACPPAWTEAFEACSRSEHHLQLIMLGINAHINNDLVFALCDVMSDWNSLGEEVRQVRRADYLAVNNVIALLVDRMQEELVNARDPVLGVLDRLLGPSDEWLFRRLVTTWRDSAWEDGCRLLSSTSDSERQQLRSEIIERAGRNGRLISAL
ncbi:MAG: hypothetical protein KDB60_08290 [Propionibacteriaceae bacterium]|nr:hypothetical protein [Propionibacteriaceae bacterium]